MAEILTAALQLDISSFSQGLQRAGAQVAQFAQEVTQRLQSATASLSGNTQTTQQNQQASQQLAAAYLALATSIAQQTQTYGQAQAASLAYRQEQDALRQALQTQRDAQRAAAQAARDAAQEARANAQAFQQAWSQAWGVVAALGIATTIGGLVHLLKEMVVESINLAVQMQSLTAGFVAISGGALGAARDIAFVRAEATRVGTEFFTTAKSFRDFSASTRGTAIEGQKTKDVFQALTETSRVLGLSTAESHRMFVAFEQIMSKGKVSAEEIRRQLGNVLPGAFEIAARSIGKTTAEFDALLRSGKEISEIFIPKFAAQIQREFGAGLEDATRSAAANFQRLGNEIHFLGIEIGNSLLTILQPITEFLTKNLQQTRQFREAVQGIRTQEVTSQAQARGIDTTKLSQPQLQELLRLQGDVVTTQEGPGGIEGQLQRTIPALAAKQKEGVETAKALLEAMYEQIYAQQTLNKFKQEQSDIDAKITLAESDAATGLKKISEIIDRANTRVALAGEQFAFVPSKYDDLIRGAAGSTGVDAGLLSRLIQQESGFDPTAVSRAGAIGLGQIMPGSNAAAGGWARRFGVSDTELVDPTTSVALAAMILQDLGKKYKDFDDATRLALAAYNAGEPKVDSAIRQVRQAGLAPDFQNIAGLLPKDTQKYVPAVFGTGEPGLLSQALGKKEVAAEYQAQLKDLQEIKGILDANPALSARLTPELKAQLDLLSGQTIAFKAQMDEAQEAPQHARKTIEAYKEQIRLQEEADALTVRENEHMRDAVDAVAKRIELQKDAAALQIAQFAAGPETFDTRREKAMQDEKKWLALFEGDEEETARIHQATTNRLTQIDEGWRAHQEAALKKALEPWKQLASQIESTLSSAFEQILSGTFDLWDSIKRGFIKLIADLAAAALTQQIIIPVLMGAVGAGSLASAWGGGGFGGFGSTGGLTGTDAVGTTGGSAGGNIAGTALGYASTGSSLYSGVTGQSLLGGNSVIGGLLHTPLTSVFGSGILGGAGTAVGMSAGSATALAGGAEIAGEGAALGMGAGEAAGVSPALGGGAAVGTIGSLAGGVGVGIAAGQIFAQLNAMMGLHGTANATLSGAGGGAIAGAMVGSVVPVVGTAIGAIAGALIGALGGYIGGLLGTGPDPHPAFQPTQTQAGRVAWDPVLGLQTTQEFQITQEKHRDVGKLDDWTKTFAAINSNLDDMAHQVVSQFQGVSPQLQEALVIPLNQAFEDIASQVSQLHIAGDDAEDFAKQMQEMMGTTLPGFFNDAVSSVVAKLQNGIKKLDPVINAFGQVLDTIHKDMADVDAAITNDIQALHQQQLQLNQALQASSTAIMTALYSPAQSFGFAQQQYVAAKQQFAGGTQQQQIILAPQLAQLATQLLSMAKGTDVLGQDPESVRALQASLMQDIVGFQVNTDTAFGQMQDALAGFQQMQDAAFQQQADTATAQIEVLKGALSNPDSIDSVIASSLDVLHQIQSALPGIVGAGTQGDPLVQAQVILLGGMTQIGTAQLQVLQDISAKLGGGVPQFAAGSDTLPRPTFAMLHAGERVLSARENAGGTTTIEHVIRAEGETPSGRDLAQQVANEVVGIIERRGGRLGTTSIMVKR